MNRPLPPVSEMKKREKEEIEKKKKARMHHMKDQKRKNIKILCTLSLHYSRTV